MFEKLIGHRFVNLVHCRRPQKSWSDDLLSSVGFFIRLILQLMFSICFEYLATKSTIRQEGGSEWNDALSTHKIYCQRKDFLTWSIFQLLIPYIVQYEATKSTKHPEGVGSICKGILSTWGNFNLEHFPTNVSLFCLVSNNKIDKMSRGGSNGMAFCGH